MTEETIKNVILAADTLFIQEGYSKTKMSQIAKEAGIATGSMYHLFENKAALLQFVLSYALKDIDLSKDVTFPIKEQSNEKLQQEFIDTFLARLTHFASKKGDSYTFSNMLSDAFDLISQTSSANLILEHNLKDCGPMGEAYIKFRLVFFKQIYDYLSYFEEKGTIRIFESKELTVRFIVEALAFWGMHLPFDALPTSGKVDASVAKKMAVDTLCSAYQI